MEVPLQVQEMSTLWDNKNVMFEVIKMIKIGLKSIMKWNYAH